MVQVLNHELKHLAWLAKGLVDAIAKDLKRDAEAAKKRDAEAKRSSK